MDEIRLIRGIQGAETASDADVRERARRKLLDEIEHGGPPARRIPLDRRVAWLVGIIVILVPGAFAVAGQIGGSDHTSLPASVDPGPPDPILTSEQQAQALEIVAEDPLAQEVLDGRGYQTRVGPWGGHGVGGSVEPITGVAFIYQLDEPATFPMRDWPVISYVPNADPPYRELSIRMGVRNASEIQVSVDLQTERVVSLEPAGNDMNVIPSAELQRQLRTAHPQPDD